MPAHRKIFFGVLLLAGLVRGAVVLLGAGLEDDPDGYRHLANQLLQHGVYGYAVETETPRPTSFRPPLYPLLLAAVSWPMGEVSDISVLLLHGLLGVATAALTYDLAIRIGLSPGWSAVAAAAVIFDPILLNQSRLVMTETLAACLALWCWRSLIVAVHRGSIASGAWCGALFAAAVLCRPPFVLWLAAALTAYWLTTRKTKPALAMLAAAVAVLAPWTLRNYGLWGKPIFATTHGGYTFLLGNNDEFYQFLRERPAGTVWSSENLDQRCRDIQQELQQDEAAYDRWAYRQAWETIRRQPRMFLYSCWVRGGRLWRWTPHQLSPQESTRRRGARWAVGGWYAVWTLLAVAGAWRIRREGWDSRAWLWGILLALVLTALHTFYWSNMRMRGPITPLVYLLAVAAISRFQGSGKPRQVC